MSPSVRSLAADGLHIRPMRPDEISIAVDWAAAEGWNPGLADDACFATVDPQGFLVGEIDGETAATVSCVNSMNLDGAREVGRGRAPQSRGACRDRSSASVASATALARA